MALERHDTISRRDFAKAAATAGGAVIAANLLATGAEARAADDAASGKTPLFAKSKARVGLVFCAETEGAAGKGTPPARIRMAKNVLTRACPRIEFITRDIRGVEQAETFLRQTEKEVDGYLVWGVTEPGRTAAVLAHSGRPTVVAYDRTLRPGETPRLAVTAHPVTAVSAAGWNELLQAAWLFPVLRAMKETTILAVTDSDITAQAAKASALFGTKVVRVTGRELERMYPGADEREAIAWAERWRKGGGKSADGTPPTEAMKRSAQMYLTLCRAMERKKADVAAVDCAACRAAGLPMPCLSHFQMNDDGAVAVCTADLSAACAQTLARYMAHVPAFLATPAGTSGRGADMALAHNACGTRLRGRGYNPMPYVMRAFEGRHGPGIQAQTQLPRFEPITLISLDMGGRQMTACAAQIGGCGDRAEGCRVPFIAKAADRPATVPQGAAVVTLFGSRSRQARHLARLLGMQTDRA